MRINSDIERDNKYVFSQENFVSETRGIFFFSYAQYFGVHCAVIVKLNIPFFCGKNQRSMNFIFIKHIFSCFFQANLFSNQDRLVRSSVTDSSFR